MKSKGFTVLCQLRKCHRQRIIESGKICHILRLNLNVTVTGSKKQTAKFNNLIKFVY